MTNYIMANPGKTPPKEIYRPDLIQGDRKEQLIKEWGCDIIEEVIEKMQNKYKYEKEYLKYNETKES